MTLECEWFVLCERALLDSNTNTFSLINCLEQVQSPIFPSQFPGFSCVARYRWPTGEARSRHSVSFRFVRVSSDGEEEILAELPGEWQEGQERARVHVSFQVVRLREPEIIQYRVDHSLDNKPWENGCIAYLTVKKLELTDEQKAALRADGVLVPADAD